MRELLSSVVTWLLHGPRRLRASWRRRRADRVSEEWRKEQLRERRMGMP